jgi:hypothetical protein
VIEEWLITVNRWESVWRAQTLWELRFEGGPEDQKQNQKPLTLALSQRERGLTAVDGRDTPTCDTESNASFETNRNRLPLLGERAGGSHTANPKPTTRL